MLKNQIKGSLLMGALSGFCVGNLIINLNYFFSYERHPYLEPLSRVCFWILGISFLCDILWNLIQVVNQKKLVRCFIMRLLLGGFLSSVLSYLDYHCGDYFTCKKLCRNWILKSAADD